MLEFLEFTKKKTTNNLIKAGFITGVGVLIYSNLFASGKPLNGLFGRLTSPFGGSGQSSGIETPGCNLTIFRKATIEKIADEWFEYFAGPNFLVYPEIAIKIMPFNQCEITYFHEYYLLNYGGTPYYQLSGEWDTWGMEYQNALAKLEAAGFGY